MDIRDIAKVFDDNGVPLSRTDDAWKVQSSWVIKHKALERLAAKLDIRYRDPKFLRTERDEAVIMVTGYLPTGREEWSIGEAAIGINYKVSGKQAAYVYAMAEKRAKDRVILKLAGLHGAYSEEEADEFKDASPTRRGRPTAAQNDRQDDRQEDRQDEHQDDHAAAEERPPARRGRPPKREEPEAPPREEPRLDPDGEDADRQAARDRGEDPDEDERPADDGADGGLKAKIDACDSINKVTDLMLDQQVQGQLATLPPEIRDEVREYAKARLVSLGWPTRKVRGAA